MKTFDTETEAREYFSKIKDCFGDPVETEQCPLCRDWTVSNADDPEGGIVTIGDEYQEQYEGECRACKECEENYPERKENAKVELMPRKELPLLIGSLEYDSSTTILEKRLQNGEEKN